MPDGPAEGPDPAPSPASTPVAIGQAIYWLEFCVQADCLCRPGELEKTGLCKEVRTSGGGGVTKCVAHSVQGLCLLGL